VFYNLKVDIVLYFAIFKPDNGGSSFNWITRS